MCGSLTSATGARRGNLENPRTFSKPPRALVPTWTPASIPACHVLASVRRPVSHRRRWDADVAGRVLPGPQGGDLPSMRGRFTIARTPDVLSSQETISMGEGVLTTTAAKTMLPHLLRLKLEDRALLMPTACSFHRPKLGQGCRLMGAAWRSKEVAIGKAATSRPNSICRSGPAGVRISPTISAAMLPEAWSNHHMPRSCVNEDSEG